jgi:hypothetical protein
MEAPFPQCAISTDWKSLYRAAVFETNRGINPRLVAQAEKAVVARARELFYNHGSLEEKEALEDALYALHALKTALQNTEAA